MAWGHGAGGLSQEGGSNHRAGQLAIQIQPAAGNRIRTLQAPSFRSEKVSNAVWILLRGKLWVTSGFTSIRPSPIH